MLLACDCNSSEMLSCSMTPAKAMFPNRAFALPQASQTSSMASVSESLSTSSCKYCLSNQRVYPNPA